ncbi:MAG: hypothetical protein GY715_20430 [Planctomycetes bacterium]|nr:hypothetical protein [Planctomycetota bacterium]
MKRNLLLLTLALSLLFNVFFAVGYVRAKMQAKLNEDAPNRVSRDVARELELDDGQREVFRQLRQRIGEETAVYDEGLALAREEMMTELERSEADLDRIDEISERMAELHREKRLASVDVYEEFKKVLSPRQRERLTHHMQRGPRHQGPPRDFLRRYDHDANGKLDEAERAEYERDRAERLEQWREKRELRRREMLDRYDTNGDGELDEQERELIPPEERRRGRRGGGRFGGRRGGGSGPPDGGRGGGPGGGPGGGF